MAKPKFKKQFAIGVLKVFGLLVALQLAISLIIFLTNKFESSPPSDFIPVFFGLLIMFSYIFLAYKIAFSSLKKQMLSPNKFALSVVGVAVLAEILGIIYLIIMEPLVSKLTAPDQANAEPYQEEPMSAALFIIVTILFSILPYIGLKLVYFYFARKRALEAKKELFS